MHTELSEDPKHVIFRSLQPIYEFITILNSFKRFRESQAITILLLLRREWLCCDQPIVYDSSLDAFRPEFDMRVEIPKQLFLRFFFEKFKCEKVQPNQYFGKFQFSN